LSTITIANRCAIHCTVIVAYYVANSGTNSDTVAHPNRDTVAHPNSDTVAHPNRDTDACADSGALSRSYNGTLPRPVLSPNCRTHAHTDLPPLQRWHFRL
jgi:hypothetical protein